MSEETCNDKLQENLPDVEETKSYGIGIRHLQMFCMTLTMVCLFICRASMGIAVLAMSNDNHRNEALIKNVNVNFSFSNASLNNTNLYIYINDSVIGITDNYAYVNNGNTTGDENSIGNTGTDIVTYSWDKKTQSLILASFFWGYVCMQVPAGILAKKFGGKPMLLMALTTNCLISCLVPTFAALGGWMLVCASRVALGLTQACLFPSTHTLLGQWLPDSERTKYVGVVYTGVQLGTIIAMPLCGVLADTKLGWKLIFYVSSLLLFINALIWYWFAASTPREHRMISKEEREYIEAGLNVSEKKPPTPWKYMLRCVPMWVMLGPHLNLAMSFVLFFVDMPTYLEKALKISLKDSALLSALPYAGMWLGSIASSFLSEWMYNRKMVSLTNSRKLFQSISQFGIAAGLIILSFLGPESKEFAVVALVGILTSCGFSTAGFVVNQLDLSPNYAGVIIYLLNCIANSGNVLMPVATSYILQNDASNLPRWRWVFLFMAAVAVITNIAYLVFGTSKRQDWDDPEFLNKQLADPEEVKPALEKVESTDNENKPTANQ